MVTFQCSEKADSDDFGLVLIALVEQRALETLTAFLADVTCILWASLVAQVVKNWPAGQETWVPFLGWEDALEEGRASHCSILAWRVPRTEESGEPQSMGSQRSRARPRDARALCLSCRCLLPLTREDFVQSLLASQQSAQLKRVTQWSLV